MKKLYVIALFYSIISCFTALGQTPGVKGGKNTSNQLLNLTGVERDTCVEKKFSVVFYVIQDSTQNKNLAGLINDTIPLILNVLNNGFKRICISFVKCSLVVVPNHEYNHWNLEAEGSVTNGWYTENTINIYLVEDIVWTPDYEQTGYAHAPAVPGAKMSKKDVIVFQYKNMKNDQRPNVITPNAAGVTGSSILHIMGHYFGLPDTFSDLQAPDSLMTKEKVRRTNCDLAGDGFCDTEADPYPHSYFPPDVPAPPHTYCYYCHDRKDLRGDFFTPPVDNIMSLYGCRCRFTQQQYNYMARYILKNRMYLH